MAKREPLLTITDSNAEEAKTDPYEVATRLVLWEVRRAVSRHRDLNSPHEAYAVILEELDEYWELVRSDAARSQEARIELQQVAATAVRAMVELIPGFRDTLPSCQEEDKEDALHGF